MSRNKIFVLMNHCHILLDLHHSGVELAERKTTVLLSLALNRLKFVIMNYFPPFYE
jgi:hypothetical protein